MAKHSVKGGAPVQGGTLNSRYTTQKSAAPASTKSPYSLGNTPDGMGKGTTNSRYVATKPSGNTNGKTGPAQPLANVPAKANSNNTSQIGPRVYKSTKPSR